MGKPCGCTGPCGCDIRGRNGVRIDGSGSPPDTMWIELDLTVGDGCDRVMDCVGGHLGSGLLYNAGSHTLLVRLSAGENQITIGPDGGLLVTGASGGEGGGQTVANLPSGTNAVVGSSWGGGSSVWPEGTKYSMQAARSLLGHAVRMVHLPLRMASDRTPIMLAESSMGWYMQGGETVAPRDLDTREHAFVPIRPAMDPPLADGGYFGYFNAVQSGSPTLSEALEMFTRRAVMVIECRETISPAQVLDGLKAMAPQYAAQPGIIVAAEPLAVTGATGPTLLEEVSTAMAGTGMAVGVVFRTGAQMTAYPPATLTTLGVSWVFVQADLADPVSATYQAGKTEAYRDAGFQVMLANVQRQYQVARAQTLALRGCLCTDPVYAYGVQNGFKYRRNIPSLGFAMTQTGHHGPWSDTTVGQAAHYRGFVMDGEPNQVTLPADVHNPEEVEPFQSAVWELFGEQMALENANTYAVQCFFKWMGSLSSDGGRWAGLFVDRPTDRPVRDWSAATAQTIGYAFQMSQNGLFVLTEYDGTPGQPTPDRIQAWSNGYSMVAGFYYGMRIEVTPTAIRLYTSTTYPVFTKTLIATITNPHRYITGANNGYVFWGRHFFNLADSRQIKMQDFSVEYTGF